MQNCLIVNCPFLIGKLGSMLQLHQNQNQQNLVKKVKKIND